jgi:hypothetical protein
MYHLNEIVELEAEINILRDQIKEKENKIKEYQEENSRKLRESISKKSLK